MLTANQVSEQLGLSLTKVYDLARQGDLKSYKFGTAVRFDQKDVSEYTQSCRSVRTQRVVSILN